MKKFYSLLVVLVLSYTASHAQLNTAGLPAFDEEIDDSGISMAKFAVYPNPTTGNFKVSVGAFKGEKVAVMILDANGRMVEYRHVENCTAGTAVDFNLSKFSKGMYIIKVINAKTSHTAKLIVGR
jgi:trimeric autotransporter adhesin